MLQITQNAESENLNKDNMQLVPLIQDIKLSDSNSEYSSIDDDSKLNILSITSKTEQEDPFLTLPENWANFNFKRKKSCILSTIFSTCVSKAINHLEALQNSIENWIDKIEKNSDGFSESSLSNESARRLYQYAKKKNILTNRSELKFPVDSVSSLSRNNILEINGKGGKTSQELALHNHVLFQTPGSNDLSIQKYEMIVEERQTPLSNLKAGSILEELLVLLARLEFDRRRTEAQLARERENFAKLKSQIEKLALKRALELPVKVQQEHDACATDITELTWHITFSSRTERKLAHKVELGEKVHQKLKEEIADIQMTMPLIEEKIGLESDFLEKVFSAQEDFNDQLKKAKEKHENTKEKSRQAFLKAEKERETIEADLSHCRRNLNKEKKRLQDAEDDSTNSVKIIETCQKQIIENIAQEKIEMEKKVELRFRNDKLTEQNILNKQERLRIEKESEKIEEDIKIVNERIEIASKIYKEDLDKVIEVYQSKFEKLDKILKKIKEKEIDIEEITRHIQSVENKIEKETRNKQRLLEEKVKLDDELKGVLLSHSNAVKVSENTATDQTKEMRRMEQREDMLRKQLLDLRKQITEERNITHNLVAKIKLEMEEFQKSQQAAALKKKQFELRKAELDKRLAELEQKVIDMEKRKVILVDEVGILDVSLKETFIKHEKLESSLLKKIAELEPIHSKDHIEYDQKTKHLAFMKSHTIEMENKMKEMTSSIKFMNKQIETLTIETDQLNEILSELQIQCEATGELNTNGQTALNEHLDRMNLTEKTHKDYVKNRIDYLDRIKLQLEDNVNLNRELASRYRDLKYGIYNLKLDLMGNLEAKLETFVNVKDRRQLKSLQERMHGALKDFFSYKIRQSENHYFDLSVKKEDVANRIESLEELLHHSVDHISRFLHAQMDFSQVRQHAMQKVYKQELIEQNQKNAIEEKKASSEANSKFSNRKPMLAYNLVNAV